MHVIIFVMCLFTVYNIEKIINLLFDTFSSTKYFHAHYYVIACLFCTDCFTYPNFMKFL
jgi:hypothetical protein